MLKRVTSCKMTIDYYGTFDKSIQCVQKYTIPLKSYAWYICTEWAVNFVFRNCAGYNVCHITFSRDDFKAMRIINICQLFYTFSNWSGVNLIYFKCKQTAPFVDTKHLKSFLWANKFEYAKFVFKEKKTHTHFLSAEITNSHLCDKMRDECVCLNSSYKCLWSKYLYQHRVC